MPPNNEHTLPEILNARYQILGKLGSGGMASVIKARDIKLKRLVALKFLSSDRLGDKRSMDRLVREAQTVSKLNHPNICILHDILEYKNTHFLVMELVDGETLRTRLDRVKAIPAEQAISLAIQIATALKAAHDSGIIHRDIKPENIMITVDGHAKVMDFGLAKLRGSTGDTTFANTNSERSKSMSGLYGTDAYMSPEQVDNLPLDEKTDIFSLGIVIYEMVTGRNPFSGNDSIALMKSILHTNPPSLHTEATGLLYELDRIVRKSLAKDPAQRQRTMHELILQLQNTQSITEKASTKIFRPSIVALIFFLSVLAMTTITIVVTKNQTGHNDPMRSLRMYPVGETSETEDFPSFLPNGEKIVYSSKSAGYRDSDRSVWIKNLKTGHTEKLVQGALSPDISPDGSKLVCVVKGQLFVFSIQSNNSTLISTFGAHPKWSPDGQHIAFCTTGSHRAMEENAIFIYDAKKDTIRQVSPKNGLQYSAPNWSGNGRWLVCIGGEGSRSDLWLINPATDAAKKLSQMNVWLKCPIFSPTSRYIYYLSSQNGSFDLWRTKINLSQGRLVGKPIQITLGLELMNLDFSPMGDKIIFSRNESKETIWRIPLSARTNASPDAIAILSNTQSTENLELSPDGSWMVLETSYAGTKSLFLKSMIDQTEKLLYQNKMAFSPAWSPDSRWIYFDAGGGNQADVWRISADGREEEISIAGEVADWSPTCSPDGRHICFLSNRSGAFNLWLYNLQSGDAKQITRSTATKTRGFWSHDSQKLAFFENCDDQNGCRIVVYSLSDQTAEEILFVPKRKINISNKLVWAFDDSALYYLIRAYEALYRVDLKLKTAQSAFDFVEDSRSPSSACVFAIEKEFLYFVSSNTISDIWIAEGVQ